MSIEYIKIGKCIWCLQEKPLVSFNNQPHTISKKIGGTFIGFDICDTCNNFFGTNDRNSKYPMSVELAFKEILNVTRYLMPNPSETKKINPERLESVYFEYFKSKRIFRIKKRFEFSRNFLRNITRQFKKGVYEAFLQELHRNTGFALDAKFDKIRDFARYDKGNLPLYFADNNGIYLISDDYYIPSLAFNEPNLKSINDFGFYPIWLFGHILYIEVTPRAELTREVFLKSEANKIVGSGFINNSIKEMKFVTELDFTLNKLSK